MSYGRGPPDTENMVSLKVDNLTYRTTPDDLRRAFEKYGNFFSRNEKVRHFGYSNLCKRFIYWYWYFTKSDDKITNIDFCLFI